MQDEATYLFEGQIESLCEEATSLHRGLAPLIRDFDILSPEQRSEVVRIGTITLNLGREIYDKALVNIEERMGNKYS